MEKQSQPPRSSKPPRSSTTTTTRTNDNYGESPVYHKTKRSSNKPPPSILPLVSFIYPLPISDERTTDDEYDNNVNSFVARWIQNRLNFGGGGDDENVNIPDEE